MWFVYEKFGDATILSIIAHEWGHRIQHVAQLPDSATLNEQIPYENQADCISGAFFDYLQRFVGIDSVATPDDLVDLFSGLYSVGEDVSDQQNHGTIDQRIRAFFLGYNSFNSSGAWDCDFYVTGGSIVPDSRTDQSETADTTTTVAS